MTPEEQEQLVKRYLLLELEPEERDRFEERYFSDSELLGTLIEIESDMIDDYATSRMPEDEKARFEKSLESLPDRRERVRNARGFLNSLEDLPRTDIPQSFPASFKDRVSSLLGFPSAPRLAIATGLILACATAVVIIVTRTKNGVTTDQSAVNTTVNRSTSESASSNGSTAEEETHPTARPTEKQPSIATFILSPGGFRGGDGRIARVTGAGPDKAVRIGLEIPIDFPSGPYTLKLDGRAFMESVRSTKSEGRGEIVFVNLELAKTVAGKHILTLVSQDGAEENFLFISDPK